MLSFLDGLCRATGHGCRGASAGQVQHRAQQGRAPCAAGVHHRAADKIQSPGDVDWLAVGLAAASLEDSSVDYRDWLLAVAYLYASAEWVGIDPKLSRHFRFMLHSLSSEKPSGGRTPVCQMLADFHNYAVLADGRWQVVRRSRK